MNIHTWPPVIFEPLFCASIPVKGTGTSKKLGELQAHGKLSVRSDLGVWVCSSWVIHWPCLIQSAGESFPWVRSITERGFLLSTAFDKRKKSQILTFCCLFYQWSVNQQRINYCSSETGKDTPLAWRHLYLSFIFFFSLLVEDLLSSHLFLGGFVKDWRETEGSSFDLSSILSFWSVHRAKIAELALICRH